MDIFLSAARAGPVPETVSFTAVLMAVTVLTITFACLLSDLLFGTIPNSVIATALVWGIFARFSFFIVSAATVCAADSSGSGAAALNIFGSCLSKVIGQKHAILTAAAGFLLPYLILGWMAAFHMIGGGDIKLLSFLGLMAGGKVCLQLIVLSFIAGAVISLFLMVKRRILFRRIVFFIRYVEAVAHSRKALPYMEMYGEKEARFCFSLPITAALVIWMVTSS